jgi:hypothetical protein
VQAPEATETQQQSGIAVQAPEATGTQQQSGIAVQELEPVEPQQQQQSRQREIQAPEATGTQQQSGIAVQELEPVQSEPTSTKELQPLSPLFVNQNKTASLSTAENNISDLDQKSKLDNLTPELPSQAEQPEEQPENSPAVIKADYNSATTVKTIEPDYTKIIMEKYKSPPNWHYMIG